MTINGNFINDYSWLFYLWLLMDIILVDIILMAIGEYSIVHIGDY
jgi:hypothetical protein